MKATFNCVTVVIFKLMKMHFCFFFPGWIDSALPLHSFEHVQQLDHHVLKLPHWMQLRFE